MPFIQEQNAIRQDYKPPKRHSPVLHVVRAQSVKGLCFILIFAIAVPLLIYYFVIDQGEEKKDDLHTCSVSKTYRVPCGELEKNVTQKYCDRISCCFDKTTQRCYHYLPSKYYYFRKGDMYAPSFTRTPFGEDSKRKLFLDVEEIDDNRLKITLTDQNVTGSDYSSENKSYVVKNITNPMMVEVFRNDTDDLIFTTSKGPTIFSESYWEWTFQLTDEYLFGLGQTLIQLDENSTLTKVIYRNGLDQDTLPIFLAYKKGSYHGLIVRHDGPLEVKVLPSNLVILRGLVGNSVVLELSTGPKLKDVLAQQRGNRTYFYKLWTLGVHLCREDASTNLKNILNEYNSSEYTFQYESDCIHQNLLTSLRDENTKDSDIDLLNQKITELQNTSKRFVFCLPPQVSSSLYNDTDVFFKNADGGDYEGQYLGSAVKFPYFGHDSIADLIDKQFEEIRNYIGDNLPTDWFLNHNWPLDESFEMNTSESLSYLSKDLREAMSSTLPWNLVVANRTQMSVHNLYGEQHAKAIEQHLNTEIVFTASRNLDTSHPVIVQNYAISWSHFRKAISKLLADGLFGGRFLSVPVCGSTDSFDPSTHESLCIRWYLMAATSPFFRISSDRPRRDPASLATQTAAKRAVQAIELRYSLRHYFYTVLNGEDEPLMRPMFYDFPEDNETFPLVGQYMVGGSIMVAHPTLPDRTLLAVYLPPGVPLWYEFHGGERYPLETRDEGWLRLDVVETDWIAFMPEGRIVPLTEVIDNGTTVSVTLKVGLCGKNSTDCKTQGSLLFGLNLFVFTSSEESLTVEKREPSTIEKENDGRMLVLNKIVVFGMENGTETFGVSSNDLCQMTEPLTVMYKIPLP